MGYARFILSNSQSNPVYPEAGISSVLWDIRLIHYQIFPGSTSKVKQALDGVISIVYNNAPFDSIASIAGRNSVGNDESNSYKIINGYSDSENKYVTFRSTPLEPSNSAPTYGVYPTTGYSLDIWSPNDDALGVNGRDSFHNDVFNGSGISWGGLNNKTYYLSQTKWSLLYDYNSKYSFFASRGGLLSISISG